MEFLHLTLDNCQSAHSAVVVIDVLRAFTTAAYALAGGAERIVVVKDIEHAFQLRAQFPQPLLIGEQGGIPIDGFDYGNSPSLVSSMDLRGKQVILRTSNGTRGVSRCPDGDFLLGGSLVCAQATARYIQQHSPNGVCFINTDRNANSNGEEDEACADYIEALLSGQEPDPAPYIERVLLSDTGQLFQRGQQKHLPASDLEYAVQVDRFNFAMPVEKQDGLYIIQKFEVSNNG